MMVFLALSAPAWAEDLKGKWYFGSNLSFLSTTDSIRSNAAISIGNPGEDGIPFTGDVGETSVCGLFCDPRPDELVAREATIQETFRYDFTAGFGLASWLNLQLDASYFSGKVGPVDTFLRDLFPVATNPVDPTSITSTRFRETTIPTQAGTITEIPVSLTGIVRFRKDSPLNPYIGVGGGKIFTSLDRSPDVDVLNARLSSMRITGISNAFGKDILPPQLSPLKDDGLVPLRWPVRVSVSDALEWHLVGGAEYFLNDKLSMVFDARYTFADRDVTIDLGGQDQVDLYIWSEKLFRKDGSTQIFNSLGVAPNTLCSATDYQGVGCDPVARPPNQHVAPEFHNMFKCPAVGDFDKDGKFDQCYNSISVMPPAGSTTNIGAGVIVVQGGKISLTGFSVAVGLRLHW